MSAEQREPVQIRAGQLIIQVPDNYRTPSQDDIQRVQRLVEQALIEGKPLVVPPGMTFKAFPGPYSFRSRLGDYEIAASFQTYDEMQRFIKEQQLLDVPKEIPDPEHVKFREFL